MISVDRILRVYYNNDMARTHGLGLTYLTDSQILFGDRSWDRIINRIVIVVKSVLFQNKQRNKIPTLNQVIFTLKEQFEIEHNIARTQNKLRYFRGFWFPIWDDVKPQNIIDWYNYVGV